MNYEGAEERNAILENSDKMMEMMSPPGYGRSPEERMSLTKMKVTGGLSSINPAKKPPQEFLTQSTFAKVLGLVERSEDMQDEGINNKQIDRRPRTRKCRRRDG